MATIKFKTFYEANIFAKKMASEKGIGIKVKRSTDGFLVEGNFRVSENDVVIPPKQVLPPTYIAKNNSPPKNSKTSPPKNTYKPSEYSNLTEEQKAAILEARKNKERDKNLNLINNANYSSQNESKQSVNSEYLRLCIDCGKSIPTGRNDPRCVPCKTLYEKSHDTRPKINEGIAGTREENKKMRGGLYGDMLRRSKQ